MTSGRTPSCKYAAQHGGPVLTGYCPNCGWTPEASGRGLSVVSRCNGYREDVEQPCTGSLWAAPGDRTARCDTCNGQVGMGVLPDHWPRTSGRSCSCGKPFPEDGGADGVCECCSGCAVTTPARTPSPENLSDPP